MSTVTEGTSPRRLLGVAVLLGVTIVLFVGAWHAVYWLVEAVSGPASTAAWGITLGLVLLSIYMGSAAGASLTLRIVAYQLAIVVLFVCFLGVVVLASFVLGTIIVGALYGFLAALAVAGIVAVTGAVLIVAGLWGAETAEDWALFVRMVASSISLGIVMVCLLAVTWVIALFVAIVSVAEIEAVSLGTRGITALTTVFMVFIAASVIRSELDVVDSIEERAAATIVTAEAAPHLHAITGRMAAQIGVPTPTIAVAETDVPEAMVVGYRPGNMHLVLSEGTIESLDDDELTAVIAHELGHVANRDAMVMTALSGPVLLADGLRPDLDLSNWKSFESAEILTAMVYAFFTIPLSIARIIVSMLSREREAAADRVAVETLGSPTSLAAALRSLDAEIRGAPDEDLRQVSDISSMSILPLDPAVIAANDGGTTLDRIRARLFRNHPTTDQRLETLREFEREA